MSISAEHFMNMDEGLQTRRQEIMQAISDQLANDELAETHDLCESICVSGLAGAYAELVAQSHDSEDPALRNGIKRALMAGSHMAGIIMPEVAPRPIEHLQALPPRLDESDIVSVQAWAQQQPETGKLTMGVAALLARQEGDSSLTTPLSLAMSIAMYHAARPSQHTLPAA